jgi:hypothetical protein
MTQASTSSPRPVLLQNINYAETSQQLRRAYLIYCIIDSNRRLVS